MDFVKFSLPTISHDGGNVFSGVGGNVFPSATADVIIVVISVFILLCFVIVFLRFLAATF